MSTDEILTALGPLAPLYADTEVTRIFVDAADQIYVIKTGHAMGPIAETEVMFDSPETLRTVIDATMAFGGITLSPQNPTGDVRLSDGSRVMAVVPPVAVNNPYLVIRKADQGLFTFTWDRLLEIGTLSEEAHELLIYALKSWENILVIGDKGQSGKDYIFNLLAESILPEERIVVVGGVDKFPVARHPHRIHLETGGPANMSTNQLLDVAAKMGAKWLVLGDLSGPEAMKAIQLMNGSMNVLSTFYADSPEDALSRLESMCLMANPSMGLDEIRQMIAGAFGLITFQKNHTLPDYRIKVTQIVEVKGVENDRYVLQPLFTYDNEEGVLHITEAGKSWRERIHQKLTIG